MIVDFFKRFRKDSIPSITKPQGRRPLPTVPPRAPPPAPYPERGRQSRSHSNGSRDDTDYVTPLVVAAVLFGGDGGSSSGDSGGLD